MDRHRPDHLRLPVAALRRGRRELRRTSRARPARPTTSSPRRRRPRAARRRHRRRTSRGTRRATSARPTCDRSGAAGRTRCVPVDHGTDGRRPDADAPPTARGPAADPITYSYQWQRCDATARTARTSRARRTPRYDLVGRRRRPRAARRRHGDERRAAAPTRRRPRPTRSLPAAAGRTRSLRSISGTPTDGQTLTADDGTWTGTPTDHLQLPVAALRRGRHELLGHRAARRAPRTTSSRADVGHALRVVVTATNVAGSADRRPRPRPPRSPRRRR